MTTVDNAGYLTRSTAKGSRRNWFMVKPTGKYSCLVPIGTITFPKHMVGKRVRFKVEVIEDDEQIKLLNE
jgi:hypothetical protein